MVKSPDVVPTPSDIIIARHGRTDINKALADTAGRKLMSPLPLETHLHIIDIDEEGERQARNLGRHLISLFPAGFAVVLRSDFKRVRRTHDLALPDVPDDRIVVCKELRERDRGDAADIPTWQLKLQFPEHISLKAASPIDWKPPGASQTVREKANQIRTLLPLAGERAPNLPAIMFASGEVVIGSYVVPELGNMDDDQLKRGFGEGWPALAVDNAQYVRYTRRREPDNSESPLSATFDYMMLVRAGEATASDSGWIPIRR